MTQHFGMALRVGIRLAFLCVLSLNLFIPIRADAVVTASGGWIAATYVTLPPGSYEDIEVDASGNLYVTECNDFILKVDNSKDVTTWSNAKVCDLTWSGNGMAYGAGQSVIRTISPDGTFSVLSQDSASWESVAGFADGSLYSTVGCCEGKGLYQIDVTSGQATPIVVGGPGPGGTGSYLGMTQGSDGKLYVLTYDSPALYRLDGSQLNLVATLPRVGYRLSQGPGGTLLTSVAGSNALGYPFGELHLIDPVQATSSIIARCDIDGAHRYPTMRGVAFDPRTQIAYVLESNNKVWTITKVPPVVASFGPGEGTADTVSASIHWPVEVNTPVYVQLERRTEATVFEPRFPERVTQSGTVYFTDRFVVPGTRYGFRAYVNADSGRVYSSTVWIDVPPLTPPPPPIEVWSEGSASVDTSSVTLDWPINPIVTGDIRIERRTLPAAYGSVAAISLTGDGHVHFVDETVARGTSYMYRAGILADTGWVWSNELSVHVPAVSPPPPVFVWGDGAVAVGAASVTLEWPINPILSGDVQVERKTPASGFVVLALLPLMGDGKVHFVDKGVIAGESYTYRAGFPSDSGWDWSEALNAEIPADPGTPKVYSLAFYGGKSFIARGALEAAFTLPAAGSASIEALDVLGRRVARAKVDASQAGAYSVHLADAGDLRPGMYFLRLVQGVSQVRCRAILLGR